MPRALTVLFTLPEIALPEAAGVKLGGEVTLEAVLSAFYVALQLAAIFCCIGAANALGSARQLLRYVPAALYEIGIACVIALTFAPQLVTDARRVREAARLRGGDVGGAASVRPAGDADRRGRPGAFRRPGRRDGLPRLRADHGRGPPGTAAHLGPGRAPGCSASASASTACSAAPRTAGSGCPRCWSAWRLVVVAMALGGRRTGRTRYRPDPWALPELLVVALRGDRRGADVLAGPGATRPCWSCPRRPSPAGAPAGLPRHPDRHAPRGPRAAAAAHLTGLRRRSR